MSNPSKDISYVLVTGAAGFIGFHLIEEMFCRGLSVLGVDNFDPFYSVEQKRTNLKDLERLASGRGVKFHFKELDVTALTANTFNEYPIDSVIHLAAKAGVRPSLKDPVSYLNKNVLGTLRVLEFMRDRKIVNHVFGSSSSIYGSDSSVPFVEEAKPEKPLSPYAASKRSGELFCSVYGHLYGIRTAMMRFFTVYGPRQRPDLAIHHFTQRMTQGKAITLYGDGMSARDYTYVGDIVRGILSAKDWVSSAAPGTTEAFNLGSGRAISWNELTKTLTELLAVSPKIIRGQAQPGDVNLTLADLRKSARELKYEPRVAFTDGVMNFLRWYLANSQSIPHKKVA